jgi:hypothetical protein
MRGFIEKTQHILSNTGSAAVDLNGQFASCVCSVTGTFTGYLELKGGIIEGQQVTLYTEDVNGGIQAASNQITAAGVFRCAPAALQFVKLVPHSTFLSTAGVTVVFSASESLPPISVANFG